MVGGMGKRAEDALASLPVAGSFIGGAQRRSIETFNRAVIDDALAPIGQTLPRNAEMGHAAVADAADRISDAYEQVLPRLTFRRDAAFDGELQNLRTLATNMPPDQSAQFERILQNNVLSRLNPTGTMLGGDLKTVESDLGRFASQYRSSSVASERQLGDALRETQRILRTTLERQNPTDAPRLQAINSAFARLVRVEGAAGNRMTSGGVFTPADLLTAIKRSDTSLQGSNGNWPRFGAGLCCFCAESITADDTEQRQPGAAAMVRASRWRVFPEPENSARFGRSDRALHTTRSRWCKSSSPTSRTDAASCLRCGRPTRRYSSSNIWDRRRIR